MAFGEEHYFDIHCHCLHGLDDGPATIQESIFLCRDLVKDCIFDVIATPHQLGRYADYNEAEKIREKVFNLNEELERNEIGLNIAPGGDVRIDERICQLIENDKILTLADNGRYILLELPHDVFIDISTLLVDLSSLGIQAIVSHPERHPVITKRPHVLLKWIEKSAHLQVTCASLLGDFGIVAQEAAWQFLRMGWISFVATDAHDLESRRPRMKDAFESICDRFGESMARLVCIENPLRVLEGKDVMYANSISTKKWIREGMPRRY